MDGILSGLFTPSKKGKERSTESQDKSSKDGLAKSPNPKTATPNTDGAASQSSAAKLENDRSKDMRLSKSNPSSKSEDDFDMSSDPVVPPFSASNNQSNNPSAAPAASTPSAVIGPKIKFKGELTGEEDLLIQGRVEGIIDLKGNHLTIGEQGSVKANLMAKTITINGTVEGDVIGQERIEIKSSSNVKGNLVAARVTLEDGAKFRGSIDMESAGKSLSTAKPAAASSSSSSLSSASSSSSSSNSNTTSLKDASKDSTAAKQSPAKM